MYTGGATNRAIVLARLGVPVRLHSRVDVDRMEAFVGGMLACRGVDTSSYERMGDQSVTVSPSPDGNRATTTRETTTLPLLGDDVPACLLVDTWEVGTNSEAVPS